MFTGIITSIGRISDIQPKPAGGARLMLLLADMAKHDLARGDSIGVNGICFTVANLAKPKKGGITCSVDASPETLRLTTASSWQAGQAVNLEPALRLGDGLGGHLLAGHVDGTAEVVGLLKQGDNWRVTFSAAPSLMPFIASKGAVAIDGVSLTVNAVATNQFEVTLIPHTWQNTIAETYRVGSQTNLEVDMLARYVGRIMEARGT